MKRRDKAIAISVVAVGLVVLAATAFVAKDQIMEKWYLQELEAGDYERWKTAIEKLGEMQSARAVPAIIDARRELISNPAFGSISMSGFWVDQHVLLKEALSRIGRAALPALMRVLSDRNEEHAYYFACEFVEICASHGFGGVARVVLGSGTADLQGRLENVAPLFRALRDDETESLEIRHAAAEGLKSIQERQYETQR